MRKLIYSLSFVAAASFASSAFAVTKSELDTEVKTTIDKCNLEVKGCKEVLSKAAGVLVFPEVTKGGLAIAFESGKGALIEGGSTMGYYKTSSASLGATIGVGSKSVIVAFRTAEELSKFKRSSGWEAGADAGFAMLSAGGASGELATSQVVGIVFGESGLLADVSLKGSKISGLDVKDLG